MKLNMILRMMHIMKHRKIDRKIHRIRLNIRRFGDKIFSFVVPIFLILLLTVLNSCGYYNSEKREVLKKNGKTITIIDSSPRISTAKPYNGGKLEKSRIEMDKSEDLPDGLFPHEMIDWYDENTLILIKNSKKIDIPIEDGGVTNRYTGTMYLYNLKTKSEKILRENVPVDGQTKLSPDKKFILSHKFINGKSICYTLNMTDKKDFDISNPQYSTTNGTWLDNNHIIYSSDNGHIYSADTSGEVTDLGKYIQENNKNIFSDLFKLDDIYLGIQTDIFDWNYGPFITILDIKSKEKKVLDDFKRSIYPSPDNTRLAVIKASPQKEKTDKTLVLEDFFGTEQKVLVESGDIYWVNWMPNQKHLAYINVNNGKSQDGLYLINIDTNETFQFGDNLNLNFVKAVFNKTGTYLYVAGFTSETSKTKIGSIAMKQKVITLK